MERILTKFETRTKQANTQIDMLNSLILRRTFHRSKPLYIVYSLYKCRVLNNHLSS